ncbi:MAG TPA: hypothetical protein VE288_15955 [Rubrobacteraceae bacterium]|jgi:hypothetical protein|nr:hypothetical protein [Rubrobacteraceae bacterium]
MRKDGTQSLSIQLSFRQKVALILAFVLAIALSLGWAHFAYAQADPDQEFSARRVTSGAATPVADVSNSGDNSNICAPILQVINTGNVVNQQGVLELLRELSKEGLLAPTLFDKQGNPVQAFRNPDELVDFLDDLIDLEGSSIDEQASLEVNCDQTIEQAEAVN